MTAEERAPDNTGGENSRRFPTVGIGTSAGGVRALQTFFESLPTPIDAAFVVIVHLDPAHQSELPSILAARTQMPVVQVTEPTRLEPGRVYVIPPNRQLLATDQHLAVSEFDEPRWKRAPIDLFFRSLAAQHGDDFAIVMSGAGADGSKGIKAVKEAGGIILVQDPDEAEYGSMPRSAIATGLADFVLPVREIATRLPELIRNRNALPAEALSKAESDALQRILAHLRTRTGHDFSSYKRSTVRRRVARRLQVQRTPTMVDYLEILRENPAEAEALFADLLISVTMFFRDPAAFQKLADLVIPTLFENKGAADTIRVWVAGAATGEEAYAVAMLLLEEAGRRDNRCEIQVFASDLDEQALRIAREGRYPQTIEADMSEERLRRFFTREGDQYQVTRELRDAVLFARHSLLKDPPFSRTDLISCRNVMIYLDRESQQQICAAFHFALNPSGYLFLGSSESADNPAGVFRLVDREARIYQRMPAAAEIRLTPRVGPPGFGLEPLPTRSPAPSRSAAVHREALERVAPPSMIIGESHRVLDLSETAGRYLQPSGGTLVNDITQLVREELRYDLRSALHRAFGRDEPSLSGPVAVRFNGSAHRVYLQTKPLAAEGTQGRTAVVFFLEGEALKGAADVDHSFEAQVPKGQNEQLQQELLSVQGELRTSREESESANEELRAANEELQSINEEYRSTAEELETSKEELQSINEGLQTVNAELKTKLESMSRAHTDIQNLMAATDVGILFLDAQLHIQRFTPPIANIFNVVPGDEGRTITDFTHRLADDDLPSEALKVLRDLIVIEREVGSRNGQWYLMRIKPLRTIEERIAGVVVTFVDIGKLRHAEDAARESESRLRAIIDGATDAIITIDDRGVVQSINKAASAMFGYAPEELVGQDVNLLVPGPHHDLHETYIDRYLKTGVARIIGIGREVEGRRKDGSLFAAELNISESQLGEQRLFVGFVRDLSERRRFQARIDKLHGNRIDSMAAMATALAHEVNQPLAAASNYVSSARHMLSGRTQPPGPALNEALEKAASQMLRAGEIISHLREFIARGEPNKVEQSLHALYRRSSELILPSAKQANVEIVFRFEAEEDRVLADRVQVEQAIINLMRNAIEAMAGLNERKLTIATSLADGMIRTDVSDTGSGLPDTAHSELFVPFTSTKASGLGIGLSISRSIVEAHYGTIWAEPNPGGGARFSFTLPLARLEDAGE
jgi:two-component system, chemotaxis family, CheB/CheR fusion protein